MEDAIIIICSTPYSKRLPEKCFMEIGGKPALQHILDRIKSLNMDTFLAMPLNMTTNYRDIYDKFIQTHNTYNFYGNSESPLHRMEQIIRDKLDTKPKYIIRITHDDMLIDSFTIEQLLREVREQKAGYGITPSIVEGAGVEIIAIENLLYAAEHRKEPTEFVSYFVKGEHLPNPKSIIVEPRETIKRPYRLTLDYYEDYVVLETIFRKLGNDVSVGLICDYLDEHPYVLNYNKLPEISLYTCVKDGENRIQDTIVGLGELDDSFEYIIVDDYSKDDTLPKALRMNSGHHKFRVILNRENKGLASSSNIALSQARGKYIMRIDAGDKINVNSIRQMKEELENTKAVICYADYHEVDEDGKYLYMHRPAREHHHAGCALMNKRWLNEVRFKDGIKHWDSRELYLRIKDKFPVAYIDASLWTYQIHQDGLSRNNLEERAECKPE